MAELELLDLRTRRKADHLVAQADAEHRYLANKLLDLHVCLGYGIGIAGTVGEEHAVWVLGKNILCGGIPRHNGEVAAGTNQTFENAPLDAAIICDHTIRSATGRCGGKGKFMGDRQVRGVVCMRLGAAHRFDQVLANELRSGRQTIGKDIEVEFLGGNNAHLRAMVAKMLNEGAGINALNRDDALLGQVVWNAQRAAPIGRRAAHIVHHHAAQRGGRCGTVGVSGIRALNIGKVDTVIADLWIRHGYDLSRVAGIGENFEVALKRGVEAHLSRRRSTCSARAAVKHSAICQQQNSGERIAFCG